MPDDNEGSTSTICRGPHNQPFFLNSEDDEVSLMWGESEGDDRYVLTITSEGVVRHSEGVPDFIAGEYITNAEGVELFIIQDVVSKKQLENKLLLNTEGMSEDDNLHYLVIALQEDQALTEDEKQSLVSVAEHGSVEDALQVKAPVRVCNAHIMSE